jgi:hypothetical protein
MAMLNNQRVTLFFEVFPCFSRIFPIRTATKIGLVGPQNEKIYQITTWFLADVSMDKGKSCLEGPKFVGFGVLHPYGVSRAYLNRFEGFAGWQ